MRKRAGYGVALRGVRRFGRNWPLAFPPRAITMFRLASAALARRGFAGGVRDTAGGARDVVAAVSELRLPAALEARAEAERAAARARGGADDSQPVTVPVQLAPYQALPVDGRITRHFTRGLPVVDPSSRTQAVRRCAF